MTNILGAEGGYQSFDLQGGEWFWLVFAAGTALLAIAVGLVLARGVLAADQGTPKRSPWPSRRGPWPTSGASSGRS
jgi:hypothetical protein